MSRSARILIVVFLFLLAGVAGCTGGKWTRYELYMGQTYNDGKQRVSSEQWRNFLENEVTPKFSDGYTVLGAVGFWGGQGSTYSEGSKVLMIVSSHKVAEKRIDEIAQAYKLRFSQDSVLKIVIPVDVEFE